MNGTSVIGILCRSGTSGSDDPPVSRRQDAGEMISPHLSGGVRTGGADRNDRP